MTLRLQPAHILMNLGVGSGLNRRTSVAAQSRGDMGIYDYIQDENEGSKVKDCGTCKACQSR